ncbi:S9 family peptidase [Pseudoalteromonas luteoviolacea]|uniref:S9 family peptidase n=1 Tax=Pseudoalteromonas luteoviolacea TaxID=43657 RepID=UPI001B38084D|nr:S9 family peptidase [Pseudoalteromonas luteoviolacea]MBQ4837623.1 S9 family peptidase [Pseudoalteromonas luteoviolacea]
MKNKNKLGLTLLAAHMIALPVMAKDTHPNNTWQYEDVFNIEYAASPQVHPDGYKVVYERRAMDIMSDSTRINLWEVGLKTNTHQPLLSGKNQFRGAKYSPDGKRLAYLANAEGDNQLYVRWLDSGQTARVTNVHQSVGNISWSPDGKWIAFTMFKPKSKSGLFKDMPKKPKGAQWAGNATYIDDMLYKRDGGGFIKHGYHHIYVVPAEGGTPRQLTQGDFHHRSSLTWSKDGKALYFNADRHDDWQNRPRQSDIYRINVADSQVTQITDNNGPEYRPKLNQQRDKIAYLHYEDKRLSSQNFDIYMMDPDGKNQINLTESLDRPISAHQWDKKGRGLYFSYVDHGQQYVGHVTLKGKVTEKVAELGGLSLGRPYTSGHFAVAGSGRLVVTTADTQRPADLALVDKRRKSVQLTDLNEDLLGHKKTAEVKAITVKSSVDGRDIQAWYALPPNFDGSKKYPMILEIHGGPHTAYGPNYSTEVQLMASKGYVVVWANPRGSTSYGQEFANLIHHDYPSKDYNDLIDVVDGMVAKKFVDEDNLFVTGGSGGGVLTAWIIGNTDRFKAAVVAKPVINWISFALTADAYNYYAKYWMPGMPWEATEHLWKHSPLSLVGNVKTPTMLLTGENDYRTPMSETEQYYQALQLRGIDTAMVRIPKAGHGIAARPSNLIQKVGHIVAWFEKYRDTEK